MNYRNPIDLFPNDFSLSVKSLPLGMLLVSMCCHSNAPLCIHSLIFRRLFRVVCRISKSRSYLIRLSFQEIRQAAEFLELPELLAFLHNIHTREEFLNNDVRQQYRQVIVFI